MKPKPTTLPKNSMDPITALLRTRPDAMRNVLKAFGWTYHSTHGWRCGIWLGDRSRLAILDLRTLSWRVGPEGKRDTWRGWLGESFRWYLKSCGTPREWWPLETARLIQKVAGPWPELQAECERQREVVACSAWVVPMWHNQHVGGSAPGAEATTSKMAQTAEKDQPICAFPGGGEAAAPPQVSTVDTQKAISGPPQKLIVTGGSEDSRPVQAHPLLECHGWPYEPEQAPNVVTFLRPWKGPRGGGAA